MGLTKSGARLTDLIRFEFEALEIMAVWTVWDVAHILLI
jgi:hypothetical protein